MATIYRCPVFLWKSHQGNYSARIIDDTEFGIAVGNSKKEVLEQLRDYLVYRSKMDELFWIESDLAEPEIRQVKVKIVPEYKLESRRFPCQEPIHLKLPCVIGQRRSGLFAACFPTLDLYFDFYSKDQFSELSQHYAKQHLSEMTPRQLSRFLPVADCEFEEMTVTIKSQAQASFQGDEFPSLSQIADPIGKRTLGRVNRAWEREREVGELARALQEEGVSVCLVAESGSGKTSVLVEAVRKIERERQESRNQPRFWMSSASRMISGMRYLGQWEERCEQAIRELRNLRGVLCFENLLDLVQVGGTGVEASLAAFLIPYLRNDELRIVAEATPDEIAACDRLLPGLIDEMQILKIEAFDEKAAVTVLGHAADYFTQNDRVNFPRSASDEVYHLFRRFQPYVAFPGKAIGLMSSIVDRNLQDSEIIAKGVSANDVRDEFGMQTGLPDLFLREEIPLSFDDLVEKFSAKLLGQEDAVKQVCRTISKFKAGLNDPNRPVGVMLFAGPTGVGKTQLVKLLGDFLFSNKPEKDRLIRLDMSEYSGHDAAERLLGNVYGRPSELIQKVRANPFSVVLLDEIEKASADVFDVLMNVFEEGRLMDPLGRVTAFNSTILVMTSNLGTTSSASLGFSKDNKNEEAPPVTVDPGVVRTFFRPEFFNRIDHVVFFKSLGKSTIRSITRLELDRVSKLEGIADRNIELEYSDALVNAVSDAGFDPVYGARPLQRAIEEQVVMPLARMLVERSIRDCTVKLGWSKKNNEVAIRTAG